MTTPVLTTVEDLWQMGEAGRWLELVRGELRKSGPNTFDQGRLVAELACRVGAFVDDTGLGETGIGTGFVLARQPDTVLGPNVAFVRADRVPPLADQDFYAEIAPDLAIVVLSPTDQAQETLDKVLLYLEAGTRLVWIVDPNREAVTSHTPNRVARTLIAGDILDGGDVLPGFSLSVAEIFARSSRRSRES